MTNVVQFLDALITKKVPYVAVSGDLFMGGYEVSSTMTNEFGGIFSEYCLWPLHNEQIKAIREQAIENVPKRLRNRIISEGDLRVLKTLAAFDGEYWGRGADGLSVESLMRDQTVSIHGILTVGNKSPVTSHVYVLPWESQRRSDYREFLVEKNK